jgi:hypothetical protein
MRSFGTSNFGRIKQPPELGRKEERGSGELTRSEDLREREEVLVSGIMIAQPP